ncbi:POM121 and ZP3 fusion protein-like isoform X9 [Myxocyprinus asiaticus]|uniref:POM121 and ZP3 fusion protein-like isoform X5 n=1 Tax=Myxocyprinus asiaticus TaxID=70543 RepID=UPI002223813B|nr:POM121 and ZP3 fusion protein-like isoform X5 [Myxocyprinus asiaticus]XP_051501917.1 POM121 and ZP3 fusion protein-like isoform X6 [Myxocyprinus asiaticus]XP_051501918.1 POM121 and ZP3 fusion protein-like isoform X7 [Myxocyprinus asiaticus]XP_051501919.1 POM121 and ZP3 fusion protein-like isoform X8 [Myxocyprinus asiaticus]XP_051501921.1 POM121 and ZP3 fusion protein-like isoform X9 [Myxocyprinus asiaticus]
MVPYVFLWTVVWPLHCLMCKLSPDIPLLRIMGKIHSAIVALQLGPGGNAWQPDIFRLNVWCRVASSWFRCFVDGKSTGSSSYFLPQTRTDQLQFQLEAFLFQQGDHPSIYITCILKATLASTPTDAQHKSCSFYSNGWFAADGNDQVCGCCDLTCGADSLSAPAGYGGPQWEGKTTFGPIMVQGQKKTGFQ